MSKRWPALLILAILSFSGFFIDLGGRHFITEDEGRFAEIGREIAVSNDPADWVVQKLNEEVYSRKPPLFTSLVAVSYLFWGKFDEFAAAFPSALFAFLTLLVCYLSWRRIFGGKLALTAGVVLATTVKFVDQARAVQVDMTLCFFFTAALFCAYFYLEQTPRRRRWPLLFFACCAFATLTKGPVGLLLPCLIVGLAVAWRNRWDALFSAPVAAGAALYALIMAGWLLLLKKYADPLYLFELFFRQSFLRYMDAFDHEAGFFYYFPEFAKDFLPWTPLFAAVLLLRRWRSNETGRPMSYFWIWFAAVFLFFTFSGSKRSLYLLPLYPPAALLVANGLLNQGKRWLVPLTVYAAFFAVLCPVAVDKSYDWKEKRAGNPRKEIKALEKLVGEAPLRSYRMMEPVVLFYLKRTVPEMRDSKEAELYLDRPEKVYLMVDTKSDVPFVEKLKRNYRLAHTLKLKKDVYLVFANRD